MKAKYVTKATAALLGLLLVIGLWTFYPPPREWVESWYSLGIYPYIATVMVPTISAIPFPVTPVVLGAGLLCCFLYPPLSWRRWRKRKASARFILFHLLRVALGLCLCGYALFLLLWGVGYGRERLEDRWGLEAAEPRPEDVSRWVHGLNVAIGRDLHGAADRDVERALDSLIAALGQVVEEWQGEPPTLPERVKRVPAGWFLAWGTSGMTAPWFIEPLVDAGQPDVAYLGVAAHELGHVAGFCAEADADFVAAVAGLRAKDAYARYAIELSLFLRFVALLPLGEGKEAYEALPAAARTDIRLMKDAAQRYRVPALDAVQTGVYDTYLRSQGLEHGVREYSFVVKLLAAAERKGIVSLPAR
jgi:hypothetical protein